MLPVDGGSARDLRAAAIAADPSRQLTGLCATAHRPDARSQALEEGFSFSFRTEKRRRSIGALARALALRDLWAAHFVDRVRCNALSIRCLSEVTRSANLQPPLTGSCQAPERRDPRCRTAMRGLD